MDEFLKEIATGSNDLTASFTVAEFLLSITLSVVLSSVIVLVYRATHKGLSYSRTFSVTIIVMAMTISFIMLIIGSNLARAFSLVGALSIIRYRNAVKESRDTAFIFIAMAVGMACGVKLYLMSVIFTVFSTAVIFLIDRFNFADVDRSERVLHISVPKSVPLSLVQETLERILPRKFTLLSSEVLESQNLFVYSAELSSQEARLEFLKSLQETLPNSEVKLLTNYEKFSI